MDEDTLVNKQIGIPTLRFEFVGMLFALAVAEVAVRSAELVSKFGLSLTALPAYTHLTLAVCLLATSWLGWSWSNATGNIKQIEHPFSVEFVVLLTDVSLLICYFVFVRSSELLEPDKPKPSAREEALWLAIIFGLYFFWDIITKAVSSSRHQGPGATSFRKRLFSQLFWQRGGLSGICFILAICGAALAWNVTGLWPVVIVDCGLIGLVFLFRALKQRFYGIMVVCSLIIVASLILLSFFS